MKYATAVGIGMTLLSSYSALAQPIETYREELLQKCVRISVGCIEPGRGLTRILYKARCEDKLNEITAGGALDQQAIDRFNDYMKTIKPLRKKCTPTS